MIIVHDVAMGDVIITNWTNVIQTKKNFPKIKRFQIIILQGKPRETCHPMTFYRITFHPMNCETCHLNRPSITKCLAMQWISKAYHAMTRYSSNCPAITLAELKIDSLWIGYVISNLKSVRKSHNRIHFYFNGGLSWTHKNTQ